ncbi:hypothetical protein SLOPH_2404, partial [Spraguea lophii 42_110]
ILLSINRIYIQDKEIKKIDDNVYINKHIHIYHNDNNNNIIIIDNNYDINMINMLKNEYGFNQSIDTIGRVLLECGNDLETSINILLGMDENNGTYKYIGSIIHKGTNALSGHYVCCIEKDDKIIILDDENIYLNNNNNDGDDNEENNNINNNNEKNNNHPSNNDNINNNNTDNNDDYVLGELVSKSYILAYFRE